MREGIKIELVMDKVKRLRTAVIAEFSIQIIE